MTANELAQELRRHVGRLVRITSDMRTAGKASVVRNTAAWLRLTDVTVTGDVVWCHSDVGVDWAVVEDGLSVEVEPVVGTHDFERGAIQLERAALAKMHYDAVVLDGEPTRDVPEDDRSDVDKRDDERGGMFKAW